MVRSGLNNLRTNKASASKPIAANIPTPISTVVQVTSSSEIQGSVAQARGQFN